MINIILLGIILLSFAVGLYVYPQMPDQVASHWNVQGEADGYMSKFWGVFIMPIISIGLFLLFFFIPKIDPLKANIAKFRKYFNAFIVLIFLFLFYVFLLTVFWNMGMRFDMTLLMIPALAALFYFIGGFMEKMKRNWFIGIRTPWTLSSDTVWEKTHQVGGKLFRVIGVLTLLGLFFSDYIVYFIVIPAVLVVVFVFIYSYFLYQKEAK